MNYADFFHGALSVRENADELVPLRLSEAQLERYKGIPASCYPYCPAGIKLDMITKKRDISFDYAFDRVFFENPRFDVYENGYMRASVSSGGKTGHFSYSRLCGSESRVTIYLPVTAELRISGLCLDGCKPTPRLSNKLLVLGDSILQGLMGEHPSLGCIPQFERQTGCEALNQSVGGEMYDAANLDPLLPSMWEADTIIVGLGTNDMAMLRDYALIEPNIAPYFDRLRQLYPSAAVNVITPPTILNIQPGSPEEVLFGLVTEKIKAEAAARSFNIIDGRTVLPALSEFFTDHAHPNDLGFSLYALTLMNKIRNNA